MGYEFRRVIAVTVDDETAWSVCKSAAWILPRGDVYHSTSAGLENPLPVPSSGGNFTSHGVALDR